MEHVTANTSINKISQATNELDTRSDRRLPYSDETAKVENLYGKPRETRNNILPGKDNHLSQNDVEQARVPLLSASDDSPIRSIHVISENPANKEKVKDSYVRPEAAERSTNRSNLRSGNGVNRRSLHGNKTQPKQDELTIPLLVVSAPSQTDLRPEGNAFIPQPAIDINPKPDKIDKCVGASSEFISEPTVSIASSRSSTWENEGLRERGSSGGSRTVLHPGVLKKRKWKFCKKPNTDNKKELNKVELLKNYRLHIFVAFIFIITVLSVSLAWYYKNEAQEKLYSSQAIFFDPRSRELTLSDASKINSIRGLLGRDIPGWMLPLKCPIVQGNDPYNKECLWKNIAILRIAHFHDSDVQCYNISWESLGPQYVPYDCIKVDTAQWYGPSNQSKKAFPVHGEFQYKPLNYTLGNNGLFSSVVDFYWLSSDGAAVHVNGDNPIQVTWNISGDNQLCFISNFTGPLYSETNSQSYPVMNYTLCKGPDSLKTHLFMQTKFAPDSPVNYPDDVVLKNPHWSLKSLAKTENLTENHVLSLASNFTEQGFKDLKGLITLDGNWQTSHGDLSFDEDRFSNVTLMMEKLKVTGCELTLCFTPYFQYTSENFHLGITKSMFVKDAGGEVIGLTNFQGPAAALDVFSERGREWYTNQLQNLMSDLQITSSRLTYGHQSWLPYKPRFINSNATPNMYRKTATEIFGDLNASSLIVEHTSNSRHVPSLIPIATEIGFMKDKMCLTGTIEAALTLGLMGYPFVMADGIKVKSELFHGEDEAEAHSTPQPSAWPSRELYIRWLQLVAFFPAFQYSIAPWEYDRDVVDLAKNFSRQHASTVFSELKKRDLTEEVAKGAPIIRPVWWLDPQNKTLHDLQINDQFLIGNNMLVAPILCEGITERDIYFPPGIWGNDKLVKLIIGPTILKNFTVPLEGFVFFERKKTEGNDTG